MLLISILIQFYLTSIFTYGTNVIEVQLSGTHLVGRAQKKHDHPAYRDYPIRSELEKIQVNRYRNRIYRAQFTKKNIEETKKTLTGEKLQIFLKSVDHYKQKRKEYRQKRQIVKNSERPQKTQKTEKVKKLNKVKLPEQKAKETLDQITQFQQPPPKKLTEAQRMIIDADIRAANKAAWSQLKRKPNLFNTQDMRIQGASVENIHTSKPTNEEGENQVKSALMFSSLPPGRRQKYPENRNKEYETQAERTAARRKSKRRYQIQFTDKNIQVAKDTLTGQDLQNFLQKANHYREKRKEDYKTRKMFGPRQKTAPKRQLNKIQPIKKQDTNLTKAKSLKREADIRAANKAAWSQLR